MFKPLPRTRNKLSKAQPEQRKQIVMVTGENLKERRLALGFTTQREFSEALGIARPTLRGWEQGRKKIPLWAVKFLECLEENKNLREKNQRSKKAKL